jgi:hypothetical protein
MAHESASGRGVLPIIRRFVRAIGMAALGALTLAAVLILLAEGAGALVRVVDFDGDTLPRDMSLPSVASL